MNDLPENAAAYTRPYHPLDLDGRAAAVFSLADLIDQLRREEHDRHSNRSALTLVHDDNLTAVLTVARAGAACGDHVSPEPTLFVVLDGELQVESASDGGTIYLPRGSAGALARDVRHRLTATTECAYLLVMARRRKRTGAPAPEKLPRMGTLAPLNLAGEAFLLALAGLVLLFLFPPVAAVLMLVAFVIAVIGMVRPLALRGITVGGRLLRFGAAPMHRRSR